MGSVRGVTDGRVNGESALCNSSASAEAARRDRPVTLADGVAGRESECDSETPTGERVGVGGEVEAAGSAAVASAARACIEDRMPYDACEEDVGEGTDEPEGVRSRSGGEGMEAATAEPSETVVLPNNSLSLSVSLFLCVCAL